MKTTSNVTITWQAFGNKHYSNKQSKLVESADFTCLYRKDEESRLELLNRIYEATNLQTGVIWDNFIKPILPIQRTHTALSIGDKVEIDFQTYICAEFGWVKIAGLED